MDNFQKRDFLASPYRSEREKIITINRWNIRRFFKLLDKLGNFLENDKCYRLADNYLIAMVYTYFLRASLEPEEYTKKNFFAALLLAYNMEEDEGEYLFGTFNSWLECSIECSAADLKRRRYELFRRMDYRGAVSRACCEIVMRYAKPEHKIWQRRRHAYHSGTLFNNWFQFSIGVKDENCPTCNCNCEEEIL